MEIPHYQSLKQDADRALTRGRDPKKVLLYYLGAITLIAAGLTVLDFWLSSQISNTGGLGNLGIRSIFSTAQAILPMAQSVLLMCLELGYLHAMLRISRGQYADHTDLKMGFRRFFPMLRLTLLQGFIYFGVGFVTFYLSMQIFAFTPWYDELYTVMMPLMNEQTILNPTEIVMDEATAFQILEAMLPMLLMYLAVYGIAALVISYRFRMANYALLDAPNAGAMAALRASSKMMRRNSLKLLKVDLHLWWYFLLSTLCSFIAYGDVLLPMIGVALPFNETVSFFVFYAGYLTALFAVNYCFRNRVEATYMMAYESICPRPEENTVVLGNIFDM